MHVTEALDDKLTLELVNRKKRTRPLGSLNLYAKIVFAYLHKLTSLINQFCSKKWHETWELEEKKPKKKIKMQLSCANGPWYLGGSTPHQLPALPIHTWPQSPALLPKGHAPFHHHSHSSLQPLFFFWCLPDDRVRNDKGWGSGRRRYVFTARAVVRPRCSQLLTVWG